MARNIFGIILILTGLSVSIFWTYPLWLEISEIQASKDELNKILGRVSQLAQKRDEVLAEYNSIPRADLESLEEFFPKNPESGLLLVNLDNLSRENSMLLKNISITEGRAEDLGQNPGEINSFPFQISVSGSYGSFRSFLESLEKSRRLIEINQLSFDSGKAADRDFYEFSLQANTYWHK